jgi:hypothetical protein
MNAATMVQAEPLMGLRLCLEQPSVSIRSNLHLDAILEVLF